MWNGELQRILYSSISHQYLISCVLSFSLFIPSVTISVTTLLFFFHFLLSPVWWITHVHDSHWQHYRTVPELLTFLGWQVEVSVTNLKGPFHPIQQCTKSGQPWTRIGLSIQTHYCLGLSETLFLSTSQPHVHTWSITAHTCAVQTYSLCTQTSTYTHKQDCHIPPHLILTQALQIYSKSSKYSSKYYVTV